ncbi:hypothetical protein P152DRAFT_451197 [Eremomyces bilateralis CBS 781.70]|uniref:Uncharacterized protein n=1 Tax=Eremomyces bilateralis CBS 781.70 TaxID=1392243 RepID=A0A6G1FXI1_9PEZI|nr:uncharacterized protein P152DRAFT_451197 [Eremomyces bilateralis CBS 781.70]KAF1810458.1 hypothetical protein P152DRAFT_451197 [Eremomyces bilateralis CBS 781.70]
MSPIQVSESLSQALTVLLMEVVKRKEELQGMKPRNDPLKQTLSTTQEVCVELLADSTHLGNEYITALQQIKDLESASGSDSHPDSVDHLSIESAESAIFERREWLDQYHLSSPQTCRRPHLAEELFSNRESQKALIEVGKALKSKDLDVCDRVDAKILIACIQRSANDQTRVIATLNEAHDIIDRHPEFYQEAMGYLVPVTEAKGYEKAVDIQMQLVGVAIAAENESAVGVETEGSHSMSTGWSH